VESFINAESALVPLAIREAACAPTTPPVEVAPSTLLAVAGRLSGIAAFLTSAAVSGFNIAATPFIAKTPAPRMFIRTAASQERLESLATQMEESAERQDEYNYRIQTRESVLQQVKDRVLSIRLISEQSSETLADLLNTLISTVQSIEELKRSREAEIVKYHGLRQAMASENAFMINA
jgi:hypothetical protein